MRRFIVNSAARVAGVRIPTKSRRHYAAQVLRNIPEPAQTTPSRIDWAPTFEELFLVDPNAFLVASTSATTLDDPALYQQRKFPRTRRAQDPDGLPLSTDPTVLDGDSITSAPDPPESLLVLPPIRKRDGKQRARDANWLRDVWSTPEFARLSLRTRPSFEQVAEGQQFYDEILRYKAHFQELLGMEQEEEERVITDRLPLMLDQRIQSWARRYSHPEPIVIPGDPVLKLNSTQVRAIALMLASRVSLVQGPPGTGKTRTIVEAVRLLKKHFHVPYPLLVCTYTNVAVDNLVEGLARVGLRPVRFGGSATTSPNQSLQEYTLRARRDAHILGPHLDKLLATIERLNRELRSLRGQLAHLGEGPSSAGIRHLAVPGERVLRAFAAGRDRWARRTAAAEEPVPAAARRRRARAWDRVPRPSARRGKTGPEQGKCGRGPDRVRRRGGSARSESGTAQFIHSVTLCKLIALQDLNGRDIGVIAPYAAQIALLERMLGSREQRERWVSALGERRAEEVGEIEVKTVDGFEGREKAVIVFSTVRNNGAGQIGFLADRRRLNVGLTRAQRGLFVAGSVRTLATEKSGVWARYMEYLRARSLVVRI
ncbi:hypothetical protein EXIGLDRAFT_727916 [Exidia glandulosa HHB12029]|uniref:P-loop containing nucleoside triphosphate hydrolase protein n=1 Tax=Exidia glandulosa HHB12029 TaxID=1314781 RepID=A0A165D5L7_EXIGL|nr:hypothetical protein EXIGLDRAFT_727916 [Exidia glandulosa HHB12029]